MFSIILTVHNKDFLIKNVLQHIFENTISNYELIVVLDGCTDNSASIVEENIKIFTNYKILETPNVFETKANNFGIRQSDGEYVIIIQDDMLIKEFSWEKRLFKPFQIQDVFAVTANTAHNWIYNSNHDENTTSWSNLLIHTDHANKNTINRNIFGIRDCVNRGPLMLKKSILKDLNYFDEEFYPQDMDDHDLCYRSKKLGVKVGYYGIDYISEPSWGGTRENNEPKKWLLEANRKNVKIVWERHKDLILRQGCIENIIVL